MIANVPIGPARRRDGPIPTHDNSADGDFTGLHYANGPGKRSADVFVSAVLGVVALPLVLVLALISLAAFRQSPFFTQKRIGRGGAAFNFYKLRSLPGTTPTTIDKYDLEPHLTRWGRILRHSKLDELPQLVNVLRGDMSIVGPRPEIPELNERLDEAFSDHRTLVRPGITGPWQVSDVAHLLIGDGEAYDRAYLAAASPRLDVWLVWRTLLAAAGKKITLDDLQPWLSSAGPTEQAA